MMPRDALRCFSSSKCEEDCLTSAADMPRHPRDVRLCFVRNISNQLNKLLLLFFDDNKIKMVRKPGKKQKKNPVGCTGEGKK